MTLTEVREYAEMVQYGECITFPNGLTVDKRPVAYPSQVTYPTYPAPYPTSPIYTTAPAGVNT